MIRHALSAALAALARRLRCAGLRADIAGWADDLARLEAKPERNLDHERIVADKLAATRAELHNITTPATARGI